MTGPQPQRLEKKEKQRTSSQAHNETVWSLPQAPSSPDADALDIESSVDLNETLARPVSRTTKPKGLAWLC